ncbi:P2x purinoceptor [Plakobranchus ocellatus]|uniref:P2x purinoceptor n=1 Tax=Plakobranchus ocellatus TaxID=259542 RepID=A0AAV4DBF0_9GAST|nr:P2x purinoceptor [Plakobranchus ocellatus]
MATILRSAASAFFEYDTPRITHIRSKKVGLINRFLQLIIIGYIIGYVIVYQKGYQDTSKVQSAVTTKLKGIAFSNYSDISSIGERTWDVADYVIPPQESNSFFVMTNVVPTLMQTQSTCPEDPTVDGIQCENDEYCESLKGASFLKGNGPITGKCVNSDFPNFNGTKVCQIRGWCPVENDDMLSNLTEPVLQDSRNFTVFIKNNIVFPKFGVARRNLPDNEDDQYLSKCQYDSHSSRDKFCPIFRLETILSDAGIQFENISAEGGVMQIVIDWTCNLDYSVDNCVPSYTFQRLDRGDLKISRGFNFRYADQFGVFLDDGSYKLYRNLYKAYGIRFLITVQGTAGKFSIVPLLLNIGSGLALLGVSTIICDIVVLYILKGRHFFREKKYLDVKASDAFQILDEEEDETPSKNRAVQRKVTVSS